MAVEIWGWSVWTLVESLAVVMAIAYLLLAMYEHIACWYAAAISVCLYLAVFWRVDLVMESALQLYYLAMAGYGWCCWRQRTGANASQQAASLISRWAGWKHGIALVLVVALSLLTGHLLAAYTDARLPWLDAGTTWASLLATWLVARKILENWLYWIVIDGLSIYLYWDRGLYQTMALFAFYIVLAAFGWFVWRASYARQQSSPSA